MQSNEQLSNECNSLKKELRFQNNLVNDLHENLKEAEVKLTWVLEELERKNDLMKDLYKDFVIPSMKSEIDEFVILENPKLEIDEFEFI